MSAAGHRRRLLVPLFLGLLLAQPLAACSNSGLVGTVFKDREAHYRIGGLGNRWRQIRITENDVAFYNTDFSAAIQINATCRKDYEDVSLDILIDHLMYGLTHRKIRLKRRMMLDRRAAMYVELTAKLDGVPVRCAMYVLKKNACIYDFAYMVRPSNFGRGIGDFHRVVYGFKVLPRR